MDLSTALKGMETAKEALRSQRGISSLPYMSEQMDRLAAYTSAVEDHLADLEHDQEIGERNAYNDARKANNSPSASEKVAKYAIADVKANVKRLTRLVGSAWKLVDEKRSRFNHLEKEAKGQI